MLRTKYRTRFYRTEFKMEGVPRIPMLAFELKSCSEHVDFATSLRSYITNFYHENADSYAKECAELDQLRQSASQVTMDFIGCSLLKKYYSQLLLLHSRFPIGSGEAIEITFKWDDAYTRQTSAVNDIKFEQACVLYNIGALHSVLGGMDNRTTPEGMKVSCTHFQCAAWAFQHLDDVYGSFGSSDMSHEMLMFQSVLMLAQAQECILEKSMTDSRKSSITAKVAAQIVDYYKLAMRNLDASNPNNIIGTKKYKEWRKKLEVKTNFYQCIMYLYLGTQSEEQQKWGERLTYFQAALDRLNDAMKLNKSEDAAVEESLRFTLDVVGGKYNAAKKDNDFVYHDKVPALETLPDIKGAPLVKGIPFNPNDPEVSGPDIFKKLVPMEAHKASSLYSEEKAKLLRKVGSDIDEKEKELTQFMQSLQLETAQIFPEPQRLPQALLEKCAAISVKPEAIKELIDAMQSLSGVSTDVEGNLKEISDLLEEDEKKDKEMKEIYGTKRSTSVVLDEIRKDWQKCSEGLLKASTSNNELNKLMRLHVTNLRLLSGPLDELQKALPSHPASFPPEDEATMQEMKRLLDKVDEMKNQRRHLEQQLREQVLKDDITSTLVTRESKNLEEFFTEELGKHNRLVGLLDQNMAAQANILRALTEANANYAKIRRDLGDVNARRDAMVRSIIQSYEVYEDLLAKTQKGVEFYGKLDSNVSRLLERTRSVCKIEQEERDKILERLAPKGPPPSRPTAPKPGQPPVLPQGLQSYGSLEMPGIPLPVPGQFSLPPGGVASFGGDVVPDAPKLKDFLPFMKPNSFGPKPGNGVSSESFAGPAGIRGASQMGQLPPGVDPRASLFLPGSQQPGSLPNSHSASPVHLPHSSASHPSSPLTVVQGQPQPHIPSNLGNASRITSNPGVSESVAAGVGPGAPGVGYPDGFTTRRVADGIPGSSGVVPSMPFGAAVVVSPTAPPGAPGSATQFAENSFRAGGNVGGAPFAAAHPGGPVEQFARPPLPAEYPHQQHRMPGSYLQRTEPPPNQNFSAGGGIPVAPLPSMSHPNYAPGMVQPGPGTVNSASQPRPTERIQHGTSVPYPTVTSNAVPSHGFIGTAQNIANGHGPWPTVEPQMAVRPRGPDPAGPLGQEPQSWNQGSAAHAGLNPVGQVQRLPGQGPDLRGQSYPGQGPSGQNFMGQGFAVNGPQGQGYIGQGMGQFHADSGTLPGMAPTYPGYTQPSNQPVANASGQGQLYQPNQPYLAGGQNVVPASGGTPIRHQLPGGGTSTIPASAGVPTFQMTASGSPLHFNQNHPIGGSYRPPTGAPQSSVIPGGPFLPHLPGNNLPGQQPPLPAGHFPPQRPHMVETGPYGLPPGAVPTGQPQMIATTNAYNQLPPGTAMTYQQPQQPGNTFYQQPPQPMPPQTGAGGSSYPHPLPGTDAFPQPQRALGPTRHPLQVTANSYNQPQTTGASLPPPPHALVPGSFQQPIAGQQMTTGTGAPLPMNSGIRQPNIQSGAAQPWTSQQNPVHPGTNQYLPTYPGTSQHMPVPHGTSVSNSGNTGIYQQGPGSIPTGGQSYSSVPPHTVPIAGSQATMVHGGQTHGYQVPSSAGGQPVPLPGQNNWYPSNSFQSPTQDMPSSLPSPLQPSRTLGLASDQANPPPAQPSGVTTLNSATSEVPAAEETAASTFSTQGSVERRNSVTSTASSLDELLSASPKNQPLSVASENVLIPKVITAEDRRREKEEEARKCLKQSTRDPYTDPDLLGKFVAEVEKFQKHVDAMCKETLGKYTPLEKEWKELNDDQEKTAKQFSMAIARCYPLKNRYPDVMPFDNSRVKLTGANDDYINASHLNSTAVSCPEFIATQSPLPATFIDFWQMVYDQGSEVIVTLCVEAEPGTKNHAYWPQDKGQTVTHGAFQLTLQSIKTKSDWIERILTMSHKTTRQSRPVVHLQFLKWPPAGVPESPASLLQFISEVHNFYIQQRSLMKPVIVSCSNGIGRTGAFCVIYTGIQEVNQGHGIIGIPELVTTLRGHRKLMVQHKEQLKFCYDAILYYAQDLLMKRGILTSRASFGDKLPHPGEKTHARKPSEDFVFGHSNITSLQSSVAKMSTHPLPPGGQTDSNAGSAAQPPAASRTSPPAECPTESIPPAEKETEKPLAENVNGKDVMATENEDGESSSSRPSSASLIAKISPQNSATSSRSSTPSLGQLPLSLADLQNPTTFKMDVTQPTKKKITKASFLNPSRSLAEGSLDPSDPLSQLDPLWSLKDKTDKR